MLKSTLKTLATCIVAILTATLLIASKPQNKKRPPSFGIDVSHHNGDIAWEKVPNNIKFVYIKATEGWGWQDDQYHDNVKGARKQGIKVGSYHFFRMNTSARTQFKNFTSLVKKDQQDLIPMVDVETLDGKTPKQLRDSLLVFCKLIENHFGKKPMIYTSQSYYNDWLAPTFNKYHLYIANYRGQKPTINGGGTYTIWQYTDKGTVRGIPHNVDLGRFNSKHSVASITLKTAKK